MNEPLRLKTPAQLRHILQSRASLVITDVADGATFHAAPAECSHVRESGFVKKVMENGERNGSYLVVTSLEKARESWPRLSVCGWCGPASVTKKQLGNALTAATGAPVRGRKEAPEGVEAIMRGWKTTQRIAIGRVDGSLALRAWPAEMKGQARAVFGTEVGSAVVRLAERAVGWAVRPNPHLAFKTAETAERFYFPCPLTLAEYVRNWSRPEDLAEVRQHEAGAIAPSLWPWLCRQGYADPESPDDRAGLELYLETLRRRSFPLSCDRASSWSGSAKAQGTRS